MTLQLQIELHFAFGRFLPSDLLRAALIRRLRVESRPNPPAEDRSEPHPPIPGLELFEQVHVI